MDTKIIRISCPKCKNEVRGTYKELFGDIPSLTLLPRLECKQCEVTLELDWPPEKDET